MRFTGKRHPFKSWYKVGFDDDGRITALAIDHFPTAAARADLSPAVLERAMLHTDNAYFMPNVAITGQVCKTNLPSNTAFRGFGGPQGVASIENIIEEIAQSPGDRFAGGPPAKSATAIDERNVTPYGQIVQNNMLPRALRRAAGELRDYEKRRREIDAFNATSTTHLRGLAMTPVKFGISFTKKTLNQANALVNIYTDGTVLVCTGGTEMGQGVNTHVRQIVADELGVDTTRVIVAPTSTDKNNNTSPTAASSGTDLNGAAAVDACRRLRARLAEFSRATSSAMPHAACAVARSRFDSKTAWFGTTRRPEHRMTFAQARLPRVHRAHQPRRARLLRDARRRLQSRDRQGPSVPLLHERRRVQRSADRSLHRRDEGHARRSADGRRPCRSTPASIAARSSADSFRAWAG